MLQFISLENFVLNCSVVKIFSKKLIRLHYILIGISNENLSLITKYFIDFSYKPVYFKCWIIFCTYISYTIIKLYIVYSICTPILKTIILLRWIEESAKQNSCRLTYAVVIYYINCCLSAVRHVFILRKIQWNISKRN